MSPAIGRTFTTADDRAETPSAVISYSYWQRRFGGRSDVLGKTLTIRTTALSIIGVGPRGFIGETVGQSPDLWLPVRMQPRVLPGRDLLHDSPPDKAMWLHVFGRLKPGVTPAQAEGQANAVFQAGLQSFYGAAAQRRRELLDQRLQLQSAARGASAKRNEFSQSLTAPSGGSRRPAAHHLRQSRQPSARARRCTQIRDRVASVARRKSRPHHPPARHRESGPRRRRRCGGHRRCLLHSWRAGRNAGGSGSALSREFRAGPAGAGFHPGNHRWRRTAVRRAPSVAGDQNRRRCTLEGKPRRHRVFGPDALRPIPGQPAAGAVVPPVGRRRVAGAHGLQPATRGSRLCRSAGTARPGGFPRGWISARAERQCAARPPWRDPADPRRASGKLFTTGCVQRRRVRDNDRSRGLRAGGRSGRRIQEWMLSGPATSRR